VSDSIADLRRDFMGEPLDEAAAHPDSIAQFQLWFKDAVDAVASEPNAMALATSTPDGRPSVRIVLLKGVDDRGFVFYTDYRSRKSTELDSNPHAALTFYWHELARQVRVEGTVERLPRAESEAYFRSRPLASRLSAWASHQSEPVASRAEMEARLREVRSRFEGDDVPLPPHWGGYLVAPHAFEFWQGRPGRFHDRLRYTLLPDGSWRIERLMP
jgi:pyridoxamine 5'-phosphate oxidase